MGLLAEHVYTLQTLHTLTLGIRGTIINGIIFRGARGAQHDGLLVHRTTSTMTSKSQEVVVKEAKSEYASARDFAKSNASLDPFKVSSEAEDMLVGSHRSKRAG